MDNSKLGINSRTADLVEGVRGVVRIYPQGGQLFANFNMLKTCKYYMRLQC